MALESVVGAEVSPERYRRCAGSTSGSPRPAVVVCMVVEVLLRTGLRVGEFTFTAAPNSAGSSVIAGVPWQSVSSVLFC